MVYAMHLMLLPLLVSQVFVMLLGGALQVQIVERMPFHQAMYFVLITLTTVGYGDIVAKVGAAGESMGGKNGGLPARPPACALHTILSQTVGLGKEPLPCHEA